MKVIFLIFILLFPFYASSFEYEEKLNNPEQERIAERIISELKCVVCAGQSLSDSDADLAKDMRRLIREKVRNGEGEERIKNYLLSKYGNEVLLKPPFDFSTFLLWFFPIIILFLGAGFIFSFISKR